MSRGRKPIVQCTQTEWRDMARRARACCPAPDGFAWRMIWSSPKSIDYNYGDCLRTEGKNGRLGTVRVRVSKGLSMGETFDTLIHEIAHGYDSWTHHAWAGDHSDTYWIWYGRIYRKMHAST